MGIISYNPDYLHRKLVTGKQFAAEHDGVLPTDHFWNYLRFRRDLNETRFDRYHPVVGRLLRNEEQTLGRVTPAPPPTSSTTPLFPSEIPGGPTPGVPQGQVVGSPELPAPQVVETPEPSSLLIALAATAALLVARFAGRKGRTPSTLKCPVTAGS